MAIGRTEDRDTPGDPVMCNIAKVFGNPVRATHLGQRSTRPHTQAGHMTAIDQTRHSSIKSLHARGPSTHGSRLSPGRDLKSSEIHFESVESADDAIDRIDNAAVVDKHVINLAAPVLGLRD